MEGAATVHRLLPKPPLAPGLLGVRAPASPGVRVAGLQASGSLGLSPTSAPGTDTPARAELIWRAAMMPGAHTHTHTPHLVLRLGLQGQPTGQPSPATLAQTAPSRVRRVPGGEAPSTGDQDVAHTEL